MIGFLSGEAKSPTTVVTTSGVGYEVTCAAEITAGQNVEIWVHTHYGKDGAVSLYGFQTELDREAFRAVIKVDRVGPAVGVALLRSLNAGQVAKAVQNKDGAALKVVGVGPAAADKIAASMKLSPELTKAANATEATAENPVSYATSVLVNLGYDRDAVTKALGVVMADGGAAMDTEDLIQATVIEINSAV